MVSFMGDIYIPESAMAIFAHPDDIEFSCAGTTARWAKGGARISYVLCTSGDVGIAEPGMTHERAAEIREAEAREAARITGVKEINFLHEPDCMLENTLNLRRKLVREIRRFRPEVVICGDPTMLWGGDDYINHPDHRAAGWAAIDATFPAAGQPNLFEELEQEGLKASKVRKIFVASWSGSGNYYVDISSTIEIKVAALRAHTSQIKESEFDADKLLREWASETAKGKEMAYAELFRVTTLENDEFWGKYKQQNS
jgi:LmbE family N-acetylglucosaminyl deacetylase